MTNKIPPERYSEAFRIYMEAKENNYSVDEMTKTIMENMNIEWDMANDFVIFLEEII